MQILNEEQKRSLADLAKSLEENFRLKRAIRHFEGAKLLKKGKVVDSDDIGSKSRFKRSIRRIHLPRPRQSSVKDPKKLRRSIEVVEKMLDEPESMQVVEEEEDITDEVRK